MKLCIPVCQPDGLDSMIHPHLPDAEHLLFFDVTTREYEHIALRDPDAGAGRSLEMDAVLCGSINRMVLRQLMEQGIKVYGVEAQTVAQAIARFENGELEAVASTGMPAHAGSGCCGGAGGHGHTGHGAAHEKAEHGCRGGGCGSHGNEGGGCGGAHGHEHERGACACAGHEHGQAAGACGGNEHGHQQGAGCGAHAPSPTAAPRKVSGEPLRVAVCSQNRKTVTEHAGKCRKFWIYDISAGQITGKSLLELPVEQSLHAAPVGEAHPLDGIDVLIAGSAGDGLTQRLAQLGIECVVTAETDLELAVSAYLAAVAAGAAN